MASEANHEKIMKTFQNADQAFIETYYLNEDKELALQRSEKCHTGSFFKALYGGGNSGYSTSIQSGFWMKKIALLELQEHQEVLYGLIDLLLIQAVEIYVCAPAFMHEQLKPE